MGRGLYFRSKKAPVSGDRYRPLDGNAQLVGEGMGVERGLAAIAVLLVAKLGYAKEFQFLAALWAIPGN
jgi:hypothetical protein